MQDEIEKLRRELEAARAKAKGKRFETHPELFKIIEAIKVKIALITQREGKDHG